MIIQEKTIKADLGCYVTDKTVIYQYNSQAIFDGNLLEHHFEHMIINIQ